MNPIVKQAVNEILKMSPDFPVERYTWIVDPIGFIGGTEKAVPALWPEFGSIALKHSPSVGYLAIMKYEETVHYAPRLRAGPRLPLEWLHFATNDPEAEFDKLPVLSQTLAIVLPYRGHHPGDGLACVLFIDLHNCLVFKFGLFISEIEAVAFDSSGAAVAMIHSYRHSALPLWERDYVVANDSGDLNDDYLLSTAALAVKRAIDLSVTSTTAYVPTRQRHSSRRAAGRKPAFEWRTVVIEPVKPKIEHRGGTHASPRQHDRRGHWSHSKLGKKFWVPQCKVGKASDGIVFHDYVVK